MPFTVGMHSESIDTGPALDSIAAAVDQHLVTSGDDILVPEIAPSLAGVYAVGVDLTRVRLSAPSLRRTLLVDVVPFDVSAVPEPANPPSFYNRFDRPIPLDASEAYRAEVINDGVAASRVDVLTFFQGERVALPEGRIDSVRLTGSTTLTPNAWTLVPLTLSQQLEAGRYAIVGMRAESAGCVAARLVIPGSPFRPGVVGADVGTDVGLPIFRNGGLEQSWGEFTHLFIPQAEFFSSSADTAQVVWLDIVKIG